ncbi:MAG: twin-arginine translocation signal domain-containing protein [Acidobacteriota bacterium]|nr:twin-arginine translocation signal domain-containing protein [Acidobacteriota bacterium]
MTVEKGYSRRDFVKRVGSAAGAVALSPAAVRASGMAQAPAEALPMLHETPRSVFPTLNGRTRGWLRFLWEKATNDDDWSSAGVPHQWWDRYSAPVVLSYGRFDLSFSAYALLLMADQTPAWREVYTRIADGFAGRYPTYWGAIDWLTQIGDDPKRENYPPRVMAGIPERLRGNYNRFGWTANGVEPWGLQPDPIGADGYLFFRGWFTLLLSIYKYVSVDDKYTRPFPVTGYRDQMFE